MSQIAHYWIAVEKWETAPASLTSFDLELIAEFGCVTGGLRDVDLAKAAKAAATAPPVTLTTEFRRGSGDDRALLRARRRPGA